jgi:uncharacterized RDD family membrane protein YckC
MADSLLPMPLSRRLRLRSMLTDHIIMSAVCVPVAFLLSPIVAKGAFYFILIPYLNKDFLQARSPAKRLLGLQIQDATGAPANELRAFLRNVTVLLWPVEVLLIAVGSPKRLGDFLAGTQVVASATISSVRSWSQDVMGYRVTSYSLYTLLATLLYLVLLHLLFTCVGL